MQGKFGSLWGPRPAGAWGRALPRGDTPGPGRAVEQRRGWAVPGRDGGERRAPGPGGPVITRGAATAHQCHPETEHPQPPHPPGQHGEHIGSSRDKRSASVSLSVLDSVTQREGPEERYGVAHGQQMRETSGSFARR